MYVFYAVHSHWLESFVYWYAHIFLSMFFIEPTVQEFNIDTVYSLNRHSTHEWIRFGSIVWCFLFIQSCNLSRSGIVCWVICFANVINATIKFIYFDIYQKTYLKTNSNENFFHMNFLFLFGTWFVYIFSQ